jgi:hypothetical protein
MALISDGPEPVRRRRACAAGTTHMRDTPPASDAAHDLDLQLAATAAVPSATSACGFAEAHMAIGALDNEGQCSSTRREGWHDARSAASVRDLQR